MKAEIPALNIIASLLYLSLAGATMFLLKLSSKALPFSETQSQAQTKPEQPQKVYRRIIMSWLKKYCIFGTVMLSDRKYLVKQLLIISVYGVACLKINRITLWPVGLVAFLLPTIFFVYQMALKLQKNVQNNEQQVKNVEKVQLEMQFEVVQGTRVISTLSRQNKPKKTKQFRNIFQIITISTLVFIGVVLDLQTVVILDNSISNSGELNLISVVCIVLLDQLILRPFSGLLLLGVIKLLEYRQIIMLHQNKMVVFLCEQLLQEQRRLQEQRKAKALLEDTQAHLKNKQDEILRETNVPIKPDRASMVQIDFQHIQPFENKSPHEVLSKSLKNITDQEEVYLTTPQKELFQTDFYGNMYQNILNTYVCNKQNSQTHAQLNYELDNKPDINCFEHLIITKGHEPLQNIQNLRPSFTLQLEMTEQQRKKAQIKRKNRRVLKLTGNSPYLEYLPNMLKNVRKTAQTTAVNSAPKLGQINFR